MKTVTEHFNSRLAGFECVTPIQTARSELELCFRAASKPGGILRLKSSHGCGQNAFRLKICAQTRQVFGKERIFFSSAAAEHLWNRMRGQMIRLCLEHHSDIDCHKAPIMN